MPFGVELPDNIGQTSAPDTGAQHIESAPQGAAPTQVSTESPSTQSSPGTQALPTLADLDKLDRFLFKGREWTRKELEDGYLRQQDYTRKMQEVSETRKYADNFAHDLRTVISDRAKMADFERIYPKHFVERAREILSQLPGNSAQPSNPNPSESFKSDPEFQSMKSEFQEWKQAQQEAKIANIQSWIDNQFEKLGKKYPHAHPEVVNNRAWAASNQGQKIDEAALEKLFKANDDEMKRRMDEMYKNKVNQQLKAGKDAKDVGTGGDISGGAPKPRHRTIKEATQGFLNDIAASR